MELHKLLIHPLAKGNWTVFSLYSHTNGSLFPFVLDKCFRTQLLGYMEAVFKLYGNHQTFLKCLYSFSHYLCSHYSHMNGV